MGGTTVKLQSSSNRNPHGEGDGVQGSDEIFPKPSGPTSETAGCHSNRPTSDKPKYRHRQYVNGNARQTWSSGMIFNKKKENRATICRSYQVARGVSISSYISELTDKDLSYTVFLHIYNFINLFILKHYLTFLFLIYLF